MQYLVKEEKENKEERKHENNLLKKKNWQKKGYSDVLTHLTKQRESEKERTNLLLLI